MSRGNPDKDSANRPTGFGLFYNRAPLLYSEAEFLAKQGHSDCVRTVDCTPEDKHERDANDDDSLLSSDWQDRTSINPTQYWAQRKSEDELAARRQLNKPKGKSSHKKGKKSSRRK